MSTRVHLITAILVLPVATTAAVGSAADEEATRPDMVVFLSDDHTWRDSSVYGSPDMETPNMQRLADAGMTMKDKPNVITVFIDDMGWSDLSCYGGTRTTTENIDRLAQEGLRFTNFYVNSPICSPSRVALSTGQYPQRHRITSYLDNRQHNNRRGMAQWLDTDAPMLARQLHQAGYATGHFGKWHMGGQRDVGNAPLIQKYGFDRSLTNFEGLGPRVLPLKDAYDGQPPKKHDLGSANLGKGPIRWEDRSKVTTAFVDEALSFIGHSQATEQPFFLNLWPDDVHSPFFPPKVLRDETDGSKRELHYAVLDAMDQQLGKLFDRVRNDPKLRDNTLILVMSDNGHEEGAGASDPFRGAKTGLYEGGIRSPLIVWGPRFVSKNVAGTTNEKAVLCALDINRSLYIFAGVAPEPTQELDGEDVISTLLGQSTLGRRAPIFWRRPPDRPGRPDEDNPDLAVRDGKWKYLVNYDGSQPQLYDLQADPSESNNLADPQPDVVRHLHAAVMNWNAKSPRDAGDPQWKDGTRTGSLVLTGLAELDSVPLAEKLAARPGALSFPYLTTISPEIAAALAKNEQSLTLAGLTDVSLDVQEKLAETVGGLSLPNLTSLD